MFNERGRPAKKPRVALAKKQSSQKSQPSKPVLTQMFLATATSLRTCPSCQLSYTRGAPDDETLHKSHCARVKSGMEWGKEEARFEGKGVQVVKERVLLKGKQERGRIVAVRADIGGKVGAKLTTMLDTINRNLSSPDLPQSVLSASKAYFFLLPSTSPTTTREKIVGCVIAQRISTAMAIVRSPSDSTAGSDPSSQGIPKDNTADSEEAPLCVDGHALYCSPKQLPTLLGIPRVFVAATYRRRGVASALLDAATETFLHGCKLDPANGDVAFSQPTGDGRGLMEHWGRGGARIYQE
ncbi:hypothetical protein BOTBODRAFT_100266 [Botryobasidium botryosum FD-172 SS1]|uniref:N-acetyltransferase ECO1 n=1 Tax=Botryobasidium botryosum (strain FD-172 SS1) TaxID=930990 RepID=A0A067N112_BOTB1|nr:hypothetical protein BOTBODRAFT_100266 [Botryobasidium botryosum FD-172 SS1]